CRRAWRKSVVRTGVNGVTPIAQLLLLTEKLAGEAVAELACIEHDCSDGCCVLPVTDAQRAVAPSGGCLGIFVQLFRLVVILNCTKKQSIHCSYICIVQLACWSVSEMFCSNVFRKLQKLFCFAWDT